MVERKYAIQIKAYPAARERDAAAFVAALKKSQPDIYMEKIHVPGRGVWHRILLGHFASADEASNYMKQKKISEAYPGCFVQLKSG